MASHPKSRRAANLALFAYAPIIFAFYGFFVAAGRMSWLTLAWPLFIAAAGLAGRYATRSAPKPVEPAPAGPRLELKAPNPAPGQCPVCGLTDLAERAVGDELLGDAGTALARVVPYGPDEAHSECAAVVPYVERPDPVKARREALDEHERGGHTRGAIWNCRACSLGAPSLPSRGGYVAADVTVEQMGPVPEVLTKPGPVKRGKLRESFVNAMAEEVVALGEKLQRELGLQPPPVRERVAAQMDAHLTWAGSHSWEQWQAHGFETRDEAAAWYRLGFTPWRAQSWRQAGFTDPDAVVRTGRTWPIELPGRE